MRWPMITAATCATIGRIALPELLKRGYHEKMAVGTFAGSGTLSLPLVQKSGFDLIWFGI